MQVRSVRENSAPARKNTGSSGVCVGVKPNRKRLEQGTLCTCRLPTLLFEDEGAEHPKTTRLHRQIHPVGVSHKTFADFSFTSWCFSNNDLVRLLKQEPSMWYYTTQIQSRSALTLETSDDDGGYWRDSSSNFSAKPFLTSPG